MRSLRQALHPAQVFAFGFIAVVTSLGQTWAGPLSAAEVLVALAVLQLVFQPLSYLVHELGHAAIARRVGAQAVSVMVGRGPWARFSIRSIRVNFSVLPTRGVMTRGVCRYDREDLSWGEQAAVALAGPAATLAELLVLIVLAALTSRAGGPFERNVVVFAVAVLIAGLIVSLVPVHIGRGGEDGASRNDGTQALIALQLRRESVSAQPPRPSATAPKLPDPLLQPALLQPALLQPALLEPAVLQRTQLDAALVSERERDAARAPTSVPPPSMR